MRIGSSIFCAELVRCNTASSHGDTRKAMSLIKNHFDAEGLNYEELAACKTMPNLVSTVDMNEGGRHLMLNGHLDVMPAGRERGWEVDPWSGTIRDGKIIGRGTSDMKAGVTAMIFAYTYINRLRHGLKGRLSISLVSDEETGWGRGTGFLFKAIPERMIADCVLTGEPSGINAISFASKGYIQLGVNVSTRGAIAGYSNESPSAIEIAAEIIRELKSLERIEVELPPDLETFLTRPNYAEAHARVRGSEHLSQLKRITVDICTIKGGSLSSVIASDCKFLAAIVFPLGTNVDRLLDSIKAIINRHEEAELSIDGIDLPEMSPPDSEFVAMLSDTAVELGLDRPVLTPDIAISDCRYWRYRNIPAYWFGPGGELCSAANEFVTIDDLLMTTRVHALTALKFLSN